MSKKVIASIGSDLARLGRSPLYWHSSEMRDLQKPDEQIATIAQAIAEIIESPKIINNPPDIGYWIDTSRIGVKLCVKIRFTSKLIEKALLRENLKLDPVLKSLMVIRQPNCTNYKLPLLLCQLVHELKG